ncbi:MAG: hypothetical protein ACRCY9_14965 [Phycicoccus sp.]
MRGSRWVGEAAAAALAAHVVLTVFENSPDAKVAFGSRSRLLARLPQWRFFAPNPGVENTHLMYRTGRDDCWGEWREKPFTNPMRWYAVAWNPGSRAPKVLFDTVQQLQLMAGLGVSYEWAIRTSAYLLIRDVVRDLCLVDGDVGSFQFMVLTSRPGEHRSTMRPVLVSEAFPAATRVPT